MSNGSGAKPPASRRYYDAQRARRNGQRYDRIEAENANETLTIDVPSESDPKRTYRLHAQNGVVTCNCRGYLTHQHCKHQAALVAVLKEKQ